MNSLFSLPPVLHERAAKLLHFLGEHLGWNPPLRGTGYMAYLAEIRARRNKLRKAGEQELQAFLASTQSNR